MGEDLRKIYIFKPHKPVECKYSKFKIYYDIEDLILEVGDKKGSIFEYDTKSVIDIDNYHKVKDRDLLLRGVLNELSKDEIAIRELISLLEGETPNVKIKSYLRYLYRIKDNKRVVKKFIIRNRNTFLSIINSVEWYTALLNIHNFMDKGYHENFTKAKKKIKDDIKNSSIC